MIAQPDPDPEPEPEELPPPPPPSEPIELWLILSVGAGLVAVGGLCGVCTHAAYSYRVRQKLPNIPTWDGLPRPSQLFRRVSCPQLPANLPACAPALLVQPASLPHPQPATRLHACVHFVCTQKERYEVISEKEELPLPSAERLAYEERVRRGIQRDSVKRDKALARERAGKPPKKPKPKPKPPKEKTVLGDTGWEAI